MKKIKLTQGKYTIVDDDDFEHLSFFKWCVHSSKKGVHKYAYRSQKIKGKRFSVMMHRQILNVIGNVKVDHINHNTLDNRKKNLRICSDSQNNMNQLPQGRKKQSKYKGVGFHKKAQKWRAYIKKSGKQTHIGYYETQLECAIAYNEAAKKLFGEFAFLNVI